MNNPHMVQDHRVVHTIHFHLPFEPQPMGDIVPRFVNLNESVPLMNLVQLQNSWMCIPRVIHSSTIHHQIPSPMASLIHNAMKITSSHITFLPQFYRNGCCCGFNLVGHPITMKASLMDLAWAQMVGITHAVDLSNSNKVKFVKILNKHGVVHYVTIASQTPSFQSIDCPTICSNSFALNNSNVLPFATTCTNTI